MQVQDWMSSDAVACRAGDSLERAAQIMWEHDCGCVPVVDEAGRAVGIITDRDLCMGAYTRGEPLARLRVEDSMSRVLVRCGPTDELSAAAAAMREHAVRRVVVTGASGELLGVLSLGDLARGAAQGTGAAKRAAVDVLEAVSRPRAQTPGEGMGDVLVPQAKPASAQAAGPATQPAGPRPTSTSGTKGTGTVSAKRASTKTAAASETGAKGGARSSASDAGARGAGKKQPDAGKPAAAPKRSDGKGKGGGKPGKPRRA